MIQIERVGSHVKISADVNGAGWGVFLTVREWKALILALRSSLPKNHGSPHRILNSVDLRTGRVIEARRSRSEAKKRWKRFSNELSFLAEAERKSFLRNILQRDRTSAREYTRRRQIGLSERVSVFQRKRFVLTLDRKVFRELRDKCLALPR
jgi:hypothetical protein